MAKFTWKRFFFFFFWKSQRMHLKSSVRHSHSRLKEKCLSAKSFAHTRNFFIFITFDLAMGCCFFLFLQQKQEKTHKIMNDTIVQKSCSMLSLKWSRNDVPFFTPDLLPLCFAFSPSIHHKLHQSFMDIKKAI